MKQVKDIIINNQVHNLSQLYIMLVSSLNPTIVQNREGPCDVVGCKLSPAVQSAAEVAVIDVCNRISEIVKDSARWTLDKRDEQGYHDAMSAKQKELEMQMLAALLSGAKVEVEEERPGNDKEKGQSDEQQ